MTATSYRKQPQAQQLKKDGRKSREASKSRNDCKTAAEAGRREKTGTIGTYI
jgi:hypothetical protein